MTNGQLLSSDVFQFWLNKVKSRPWKKWLPLGFCQFLRGFPSFFANQIANCLVRVVFGIVVWGFAVLILRIFLFYHVKNIFANWQVTVFGSQVKGTTTMGTYWNRVDKDQLISEHTFSYNLNNCILSTKKSAYLYIIYMGNSRFIWFISKLTNLLQE